MKLLYFIGIALGLFGIYISYMIGDMNFCEKTLPGGGTNTIYNPSTPMTWIGFTCAYLVLLCAYNLKQLYKKTQ
jgi:hypothetical protein